MKAPFLNEPIDKTFMSVKKNSKFTVYKEPSQFKSHNHLGNNFHIASKKALFYNMRSYYEAIGENVFNYLPLTFHVINGLEDKEFDKFSDYYR